MNLRHTNRDYSDLYLLFMFAIVLVIILVNAYFLTSTINILYILVIVIALISILIASYRLNMKSSRQKKSLSSTIIYDNQLLSIKGIAQREPWKDTADSRRLSALFFCNRISLVIKNEGSLPVDTDVSKEPLVIAIDVKGKLEKTSTGGGIELLAVKPTISKLELSTRDGLVIVDHIHLEPKESKLIIFLGYFKVDLEELY